MTGLTAGGFTAESTDSIKERIEGKIEAINPGFDFSPESPDGQLIGIMSFELAQAWSQLKAVYNSYNPQLATGAALRNLGLITGLPYGVAKRSYANLETQGTTGTVIPKQTKVTIDGNEFYVSFDTTIPSNMRVVSEIAGPVPVPANATVEIVSPIVGWTGCTMTQAGTEGTLAMSEQQYRNYRHQTVMRNSTSVASAMKARLLELGLSQASIIDNDSLVTVDGQPAGTIQVVLGELGDVSEQDVAKVILEMNSLGTPTHSATGDFSDVVDSQGHTHRIHYSLSTEVQIEVNVDVTFLSDNVASAKENIENSLSGHINSLGSGDDVIWSRLFGYVLPYAKAQVNSLTINRVGDVAGIVNLPMASGEYANITTGNLNVTVTP